MAPKIDRKFWEAVCENESQVNEIQAIEESIAEVQAAVGEMPGE